MDSVKIPAPTSGGLILSYKCSAACRHCMYACSPRWKGDWISGPDLQECLTILAGKIQPSPWGKEAIGLSDGLHFTGGEPFLNFELLLQAVEWAEELEIPSTFVETNAFWCRDDEQTRLQLLELKNKGLKGIMISVNPFYAEYVPFERTQRCIRVSRRIFGTNVFVYQLEYYRLFLQAGIRDCISIEEYLKLMPNESLSSRVEMFLQGKAVYALRHLFPAYSAAAFFRIPCSPPFLRDWHNHFDNYGNVMPGFCGGISLGHWRDLDKLIESGIKLADYPILSFLIRQDMAGLFSYAGNLGYQEDPDGYISKCHLCVDIRRYLASAGLYPELQPREFYTQLTSKD